MICHCCRLCVCPSIIIPTSTVILLLLLILHQHSMIQLTLARDQGHQRMTNHHHHPLSINRSTVNWLSLQTTNVSNLADLCACLWLCNRHNVQLYIDFIDHHWSTISCQSSAHSSNLTCRHYNDHICNMYSSLILTLTRTHFYTDIKTISNTDTKSRTGLMLSGWLYWTHVDWLYFNRLVVVTLTVCTIACLNDIAALSSVNTQWYN